MSVLQMQLDNAIDRVLELIEQGYREGVELDPLQTIMSRLQARGQQIDLAEAPPMLRMLLGGMGVE